MNTPLVAAAVELLRFCETHQRQACLIGGMAVARWGEPRMTQDVDATILTDFGEELKVLDVFLGAFVSRDPDPAQRATLGRLLLLTASNGVELDVSLAVFPFELGVLERSSEWYLPSGERLRTCSADDLIVYKLVAARPIDLHDVDGVVTRQHARLNVEHIRLWGGRFADITERPELLAPFERSLRKVE